VAFLYREREDEARITVSLIESHSRKALAIACSVLDRAALGKAVETIEAELDGIDILVNNAGVSQSMPFPLIEEEDWDRVMDINVKGTYNVTHSVVRNMIRRRAGKIINISSLAGVTLIRAPVHYATAKAAIQGFTMSLSKELARYGIHVNCVAPGLLETGVAIHVGTEERAEYLKHCSLGRLGTCEEIAELIAFMGSDRCSYLSGATILADGGV